MGRFSCHWDRDNRLIQVSLPNGTTNSFAYDANGLRVQKVDSTGTARYLLDGASVADEIDGSGNVTTSYLNHPQAVDEVLSFQQGGATYYPLTDALGSVYAIADSSGHVVRTNSYDVYGTPTTSGTGPQIAFGFTGREHDADTGLNYNRDRYLNPTTGTWLQADRAGMVNGPSMYAYGDANPIANVDPSGRDIAVIENGPVLKNPAGHTAVAITHEGVYSFGTGTPPGSSLREYMAIMSQRRWTSIYVLKTDDTQDLLALVSLEDMVDIPLQSFPDNCALRSNEALDMAGIPARYTLHYHDGPDVDNPAIPGSAGRRALLNGATVYFIMYKSTDYPSDLLQFEPSGP